MSKVYVMRVDKENRQYRGYLSICTDLLLEELGLCGKDMELIRIGVGLFVLSIEDSVIRGLPLNRAIYDGEGRLRTLIAGNAVGIRCSCDGKEDVTEEDITYFEERMRAVITVSHGLVFTKDKGELPEWKKANEQPEES